MSQFLFEHKTSLCKLPAHLWHCVHNLEYFSSKSLTSYNAFMYNSPDLARQFEQRGPSPFLNGPLQLLQASTFFNKAHQASFLRACVNFNGFHNEHTVRLFVANNRCNNTNDWIL